MKNKVKQTIQKYNLIEKDEKVLVAVSGGPDSLALLQVLLSLKYDVCVAHVNHGLRENAISDEIFVRQFCEERKIPCFVKQVSLKSLMKTEKSLKGMSLEEAGRKVRYDFFEEMATQNHCTKIALAHNANDNVETVMMNLLRGSGLTGLKGIEPKRGKIVRPLLEVSREEIEAYCKAENLTPRQDESNQETIYTRNKIRLELIPYIEKNINSNVMQNISRMSEIVREEERYLSKQAELAYQSVLQKEEKTEVICDLKAFNLLDIVLKRRIILKSIIKVLGNAKDIEKVHVDDIVKLCKNNVGGKYLTPNQNIKVSVGQGKVKFKLEKESKGGANEKAI